MAKANGESQGHNSRSLTGDEKEALFLFHLAKVREENTKLAEIMEKVKEVKAARGKVRNLAKQDGFPLTHIDSILYREKLSRSDLEAEAELHRWMDQMAGLPVGGQGELFAALPDTAKDAMHCEADGYQAGIRGADAIPGPDISSQFITNWMTGWHNGQTKIAMSMTKVAAIDSRALTEADEDDQFDDSNDEWGEEE